MSKTIKNLQKKGQGKNIPFRRKHTYNFYDELDRKATESVIDKLTKNRESEESYNLRKEKSKPAANKILKKLVEYEYPPAEVIEHFEKIKSKSKQTPQK